MNPQWSDEVKERYTKDQEFYAQCTARGIQIRLNTDTLNLEGHMIYKTIDEWIEHNPNHIGAIPIEVCHQIWGTKGKETSMIEDDDDIQEYKKPWVGLTDEERLEVAKHNMLSGLDAFAKAIERLLKEKNT